MYARLRGLWTPLLILLLVSAKAHAQPGTISGRVVDGDAGEPLENATVRLLRDDGTEIVGEPTDPDGVFEFEIDAGAYTVAVDLLGYSPSRIEGVSVDGGTTRSVRVSLEPRPVVLNPIIVSASRSEEKALDAPATISVVETEEIEKRAAPTSVEHVKGVVGVDVSQSGIQQANVVPRGFNNAFSGAMLVIQDNRYARVPSLNVNVYSFIPATNLDLDRIEVVLGPGAALYGPNAANGVMHLVTTSPINSPGTDFSLAAGERSVFHGEFRHAVRLGNGSGIKISGQYFRGDDFEFFDTAEQEAREAALPADPDTRIGLRDFDVRRWSGEVRFDTRPWGDGEVILAAGANRGTQTELTSAGTAQAEKWTYGYGQVRVRKGRFFAQSFVNLSDAGDSFLLRTGDRIEDDSFFLAGQVQHGVGFGERQDLIYGIDLQRTEPRTEGTITGRHEDDDTIDEVGGYLHSSTTMGDGLELITAARIDWHNRLQDPVFSPRAGLVYEPAPGHNLRLTFNRAFSTPTTNNLFLDVPVGTIPLGPGFGYTIRTLGTPESGFTFGERCPGGFMGGLCMRTPFVPGQLLPANAAVAFNALVEQLFPPELQPFVPNLLTDAPNVGTILRRFDPEQETFVEDPMGPVPINRIDPTITQTFELGYKGILGDRVLLMADLYRTSREDFISPLQIETPNVFLDPGSTAAFIQQQLTPLVESGQLTPDQLVQLVGQMTGLLAQVPIGTVVPDQADTSDILLTYRNVEEKIDLWGGDIAAEVLLTHRMTLKGTFSWVSDDCFEHRPGDCTGPLDIALNAPQAKGSIGLSYDRAETGFDFEGQARVVDGFPVNSGVYVGRVPGYAVFDLDVGYRLPDAPHTRLSLTVTNLFDNEHREFIGGPEIGRMALVRIQHEL